MKRVFVFTLSISMLFMSCKKEVKAPDREALSVQKEQTFSTKSITKEYLGLDEISSTYSDYSLRKKQNVGDPVDGVSWFSIPSTAKISLSASPSASPTIPKFEIIGGENEEIGKAYYIFDRSNLSVNSTGDLYGYVAIRDLNGDLMFKIELDNNGDMHIGEPQQLLFGWWSCTYNCFSDAVNACDLDPECRTLCFLTNCQGSIMASCSLWCMINDDDNGPFQHN